MSINHRCEDIVKRSGKLPRSTSYSESVATSDETLVNFLWVLKDVKMRANSKWGRITKKSCDVSFYEVLRLFKRHADETLNKVEATVQINAQQLKPKEFGEC